MRVDDKFYSVLYSILCVCSSRPCSLGLRPANIEGDWNQMELDAVLANILDYILDDKRWRGNY